MATERFGTPVKELTAERSSSAASGDFKLPHLMQTKSIQPSALHKLPTLQARQPEQIIVKEADLRRYGHDLSLLRGCHMPPRETQSRSQRSRSGTLDVSSESEFERRCRASLEVEDVWKGMKNPEYGRGHSEQDLILNQVWINVLPPPRNLEVVPAVPAEAVAQASRNASGERMAPTTSEGAVRTRRRSSKRRASAPEQGGPAVERERKTPVEVTSRIQPLESVLPGGDDEFLGEFAGSVAVRAAARAQRHGLRHLEGHLHYDSLPRAAWFAVDPATGGVHFYHKNAAERLEEAYFNGRASVPMAGLGPDVDGAIVILGTTDEDEPPVEVALDGSRKEVGRLPVPSYMIEATVRVSQEKGRWRLVREAAAPPSGAVQERVVPLSANEVVTTWFPRPPPSNPDQRLYFLNFGADVF